MDLCYQLHLQGYSIVGVSLEKAVETADKETRAAFDNFRNQLVQQNCHRDVEIRWVSMAVTFNHYIFHCKDLGLLGHP